MSGRDLCWDVEEACLNALPPVTLVVSRGWSWRLSGGSIRRMNCVNPLKGARQDAVHAVEAAENFYRANDRAVVFRVPSIADEMDAPLAARGYEAGGETVTLAAGSLDVRSDGGELSAVASAAWLAARQRIGGISDADQKIYGDMVVKIPQPRMFASCIKGGEVVSLAYGVIGNGWLVLESVATDAAHRQQGLGRQVVGGLMGWAKAEGAQGACLQVVADNEPGLALYRSLGFDVELYRYHYRVKPAGAP